MQIYFVNLALKKIHKCVLKRCGLAVFKVTTSLEDIFGCSCYHGVLRPPLHLHVEEVELPLKVLPQLLQVRWLRPEHLALKKLPHKKKSRGLRSGLRVDHSTPPFRSAPIAKTRPTNFSDSSAMNAGFRCTAAPSCHHAPSRFPEI